MIQKCRTFLRAIDDKLIIMFDGSRADGSRTDGAKIFVKGYEDTTSLPIPIVPQELPGGIKTADLTPGRLPTHKDVIDYVLSQALAFVEHGKGAVLETDQSSAVRADPHVALTVLE